MRVTRLLPVGVALFGLLPTISAYAIRDTKAVIVDRGIIVTFISDAEKEALASKLSKRQEEQPQTAAPSRTQQNRPSEETPTEENPPELSQAKEETPTEQTEVSSTRQGQSPTPTQSEKSDQTTEGSNSKPTPTDESTNETPTESAVELTETGDAPPEQTSVPPDPNGLPYTPPLTPAFAFAGFVLLLCGIPYTLAGVRHKQVHVFMSTALLASLGVAVLIIYVMNPPVANSLQGGYVAAVIVTGLILGGLAVVFPEVTEVLACLLGGFCLAQWFLVLQPGGLVKGGWQKIIFILCFSLGLFGMALYHKTRPYGMIFSIAFSGATVTVLGIDFFSRAGLKEFWLYVWELNDNIFPLGTDTFPMTRGIKVEIAAIVIITCFGIISQMKLWQVIKQKRLERDEARQQREADIEAMEAENGRRVEAATQKDRELWEKQYGDKPKGKLSGDEQNADSNLKHLSHDSGLGQSSKHSSDGDSAKHGATDNIELVGLPKPTVIVTSEEAGPFSIQNNAQKDEITPVNATNIPTSSTVVPEIVPPTEPPKIFAPAVVIREKGDIEEPLSPGTLSQSGLAGPIAVHTIIVDTKKEDDDDDASSLATFADSVRDDKRKSMPLSIISIPALNDIDEVPHDDAASSVAGTIDDDDDRSDMDVPLVGDDNGKRRSVISLGRRGSWASNKRLSIVSLGRKGSIRSNKSSGPLSPTSKTGMDSPRISEGKFEEIKDDKSDLQSVLDVALNMTPEGEKETSRRLSLMSGPEVATSASRRGSVFSVPEVEKDAPVARRQSVMSGPELTVPGASIGEVSDDKALSRKSSTSSFRQAESEALSPTAKEASESERPISRRSSKSSVLPPPAPLRQGSLQHVRPPSRLVKTYRVSEWAKHLDPADEPQMDEIEAIEPSTAQETAAPVHVMELQEGASSQKVLPPAPVELSRSNTANTLPNYGVSRSNTLTTIRETQGQPVIIEPPTAAQMQSSGQIPTVVIGSPAPSIRGVSLQMTSPILSQPLVESPIEDRDIDAEFSQPLPMGETLLSKRESMLKAIPPMAVVPENVSAYNQALMQQQQQPIMFPPGTTISPNASSSYLPQRQSLTGSPYLNPQRNSSGTTYAASMISSPSLAPSGRMTSLDQYGQSTNPYFSAGTSVYSPSPVPQGALETVAPQAPQPSAADRRENMLRAWRESLMQDQVISARTKHTIQDRRNVMMQEHAMVNAHEKAREVEKGIREGMIDDRYKNTDMLAVHRAAMKRMQEKANKASGHQ